MTSPVEEIEVRCPKCGQVYSDWYRPSINLTLDDFDDEYVEAASTSTCPKCGHKVRHSVLTVGADGVWTFSEGDGEQSDQDQPE
jgi:DNA-directed RNA polymerase subunit RPC12/RpoP